MPAPVLTATPVAVAYQGKDEEQGWGTRLWHAGTALVDKAKVEARDYIKEKVGVVEGVVTEAATFVDTVIWADYAGSDLTDVAVDKAADVGGLSNDKREALRSAVQSFSSRPVMKALRAAARKADLVDPVTGAPSTARAVSHGFDWVEKKADETVFRGLPKEEGLLSSRDIGVLEGSIGSQIALAFVDVEEVQLALKALGAIQSVEGVVAAIQANPKGWKQDRNFWLQVINLVLYMAGRRLGGGQEDRDDTDRLGQYSGAHDSCYRATCRRLRECHGAGPGRSYPCGHHGRHQGTCPGDPADRHARPGRQVGASRRCRGRNSGQFRGWR